LQKGEKEMGAVPTEIIIAIISAILVGMFTLIWRILVKKEWIKKKKTLAIILNVFICGVVIVMILLLINDGIIITSPPDGALVPQNITVEGYTTLELTDNQHLYIVVERVVEYGEYWWPQTGEITVGYSSTTKRYEFSTPARIGKNTDFNLTFGIRAILVDSAIHEEFQNWFQTGEATGEWPAIPITLAKRWGEWDQEIGDYINVKRQPRQ
jgi:hypothetical protein